jgi:hypothetical protein
MGIWCQTRGATGSCQGAWQAEAKTCMSLMWDGSAGQACPSQPRCQGPHSRAALGSLVAQPAQLGNSVNKHPLAWPRAEDSGETELLPVPIPAKSTDLAVFHASPENLRCRLVERRVCVEQQEDGGQFGSPDCAAAHQTEFGPIASSIPNVRNNRQDITKIQCYLSGTQTGKPADILPDTNVQKEVCQVHQPNSGKFQPPPVYRSYPSYPPNHPLHPSTAAVYPGQTLRL